MRSADAAQNTISGTTYDTSSNQQHVHTDLANGKDLLVYLVQMRRIAVYGGPRMLLLELNDQRLDNYYNQRSGPTKPQTSPQAEMNQIINRIRLALHSDKHDQNGLPRRLRQAAQTMQSYIENLKNQ